MVHWKKVAVLCMVLSLLLTTPVLGSSGGDSDAGAANKTEQAGEAAAESSDKSATEEAAGEAADKAATEKAAAEASDKDTTEKAAAEASDKDAADAAGEASTEAAGADAGEEKKAEVIPYWTEDSPAMASIVDYVKSLTDENSDEFVPEEERVAVFDMDGTLYGELFPTYFDQCLLMYRLLHDDTYQASAEDREFAQALETALLHGEKEPDSPRSTAQMAAESFKGYTVEQYRDYVRKFMSQPAVGFENMTYGEGFYEPMAALVQYLAEHGFRVYICSGTERSLARELSEDKLGKWIPPYQVIGSSFSLTATGKGDTADRDYTYTSDDQVLLEGNMTYKNLKWGKIVNIVDEIGIVPQLAFGNSSGDFAMAQYTVQNGGKAYMLLCDDTERDYGNVEKAASFEQKCKELGFKTVSMKNEFKTIYGENVKKTSYLPSEETGTEETGKEGTAAPAEEAAPAATGASAEEAAPASTAAPAEEESPQEEQEEELQPAA